MGQRGGTDHEHPPLSLEEVLPMSDAPLDLVAPLNVGIVDVSPALQQHVGHEEHEGAQLLLFLHFDGFNREAARETLSHGDESNVNKAGQVL